MAAPHEVYSFVNKFMSLCRNGEKANLSLECNHGKAVVNLEVHLRQYPPPAYYPHPPPPRPSPEPRPYQHPSPSRLRRSKRREHAREEKKVAKINETEKVDCVSANNDVIECANVTEQVVASASKCGAELTGKASNNIAQNVDDVTAEQAVCDKPEPKQTSINTFHDDTAIDDNNDAEKSKNSKTDDEPDTVAVLDFMEDFKKSFTLGLRETVRQGVKDAFKPP